MVILVVKMNGQIKAKRYMYESKRYPKCIIQPERSEITTMALLDFLLTDPEQSTKENSNAELQEILSIQRHLSYLLNTRGGCYAQMPDYGMPDLHLIYTQIPYSIEVLKRDVIRLTSRYERRLSNVKVLAQEKGLHEKTTITLIISATLFNKNPVNFTAMISKFDTNRVILEKD